MKEDSFDPEYCVSLLQRSLKKKSDSVLLSIEDYSITEEQRLRMKIVVLILITLQVRLHKLILRLIQ